jgi:hypothetical protein
MQPAPVNFAGRGAHMRPMNPGAVPMPLQIDYEQTVLLVCLPISFRAISYNN